MSTNKTLIYAIHGFLGRASDWDFLRPALPHAELMFVNLFDKSKTDFFEIPTAGKKIFVGYSLGGRIGLSFLKNNHDQFDHYMFISTNPGFSDNALQERETRFVSDKQWAEKISEKNWSKFVQEWNAQEVFHNTTAEIEPKADSYDLDKLKSYLLQWSLAKQLDYRDLIRTHQNKITWVVGDRDEKFSKIAEEMKNKKILSDYERISSGHRVLLDNQQAVINLLSQLI